MNHHEVNTKQLTVNKFPSGDNHAIAGHQPYIDKGYRNSAPEVLIRSLQAAWHCSLLFSSNIIILFGPADIIKCKLNEKRSHNRRA